MTDYNNDNDDEEGSALTLETTTPFQDFTASTTE